MGPLPVSGGFKCQVSVGCGEVQIAISPNKQAPARSTMSWSAVVATAGLQRAENGLGGLCTLELVLQLAQTQASAPRPPAVWLLTLGTQSVAGDAVSATHAGSWGLARSVRADALPGGACAANVEPGL